ncbi:hypothetical protein FOQG_19324 [Fusarium oxysporum f. sp. raphani 54005]|uniref:Uncharacterized protein n=3 Tax=Fusarium oxysporum TaxID=5507 RepID=X0BZE6_FUSOX|nr:hypothetical protein FOQG_19324 [Fusarium oxysporum f. sp. raphani 54005]KAH7189811.1 hypothetical protein DER44DRAFT_797989 [Fusarium oxysporum]RKK59532.1 hypothetical protein BFJ69_g17298 [Fusarium oxysporum]RYC78476.1 hypothetical protein BFJ63_vAg18650 [Fusarium oxysporum f. sp. narcissi]
MRAIISARNLARLIWANIKTVCRAIKTAILMSLPFYGLTLILGFYQGIIIALWYSESKEQNARFLLKNVLEYKITEYFDEPYDNWSNVAPVFHVPQIINPLEWTAQLGLKRPTVSGLGDEYELAGLGHLYRRTRRYSKTKQWHHWIYLSAQQEPWRQADGPILQDPWDKAFVELLEYRDKHDTMGRSNFLYVSCPKSFLCGSWRVTAPALLHFTTEGNKSRGTGNSPDLPNYTPVNARVFELPLRQTAIPGVFPSHFEQMRSLTASNSTFWQSKGTYSHFDQVLGQTNPVLKNAKTAYPWTYGLLVKAENKWTRLWAIEDTDLRGYLFLLSFASSVFPTYLYKFAPTNWSAPGPGPEHKSKDPLAQTLQSLVDMLSAEEKERFRKTDRGGRILGLAERGLKNDQWNTREEVLKDISKALGLDRDRKVKGR